MGAIPNDNKERVRLLVNNLIAAFKELVGESIWMDEETQVWKKI